MGQVHVDSWELPTLKPPSFQSSPTYAHAQQVEVSAWGPLYRLGLNNGLLGNNTPVKREVCQELSHPV